MWTSALAAQPDSRSAAIRAIARLGAHYKEIPLLSFDILYRYSDEKKPGIYMDSLRGSFKMDGQRYWYLLDSTEMVYTEKSVVILYRQDKLMYLSAPSAQSAAANPLVVLDSFLSKKEGIQYELSNAGGETTVTLRFGSGYTYKRVEYHIEDKTGLLRRMVSVVKSEQLYDPSVRTAIAPGESYAVVETLFSNYREKGFDAGVFDTGRYFKKEGGNYTSIAPYDDYKIFLGKTGL